MPFPIRRWLFSRPARRVWTALLALLSALVLVLGLLPAGTGASTLLGWDKADHAAGFALLAFCGVFALRHQRHGRWWLTSGLLALGAVIELGQMAVPGRSADLADLLADAAGVAVGLVLGLALARRLDRRTSPRPEAE